MNNKEERLENILLGIMIISSILMGLIGFFGGNEYSISDKIIIVVIYLIMIFTAMLYFSNKFWDVSNLKDIFKASLYLLVGLATTIRVLTGLDWAVKIVLIILIITFIIIEYK